ncbi:choice-of-anchor J domain-containing protein [Chryseobacterium sp. OSA05B]|uniref:T9SS-dependent choice-of-anchor J family protein n=1 Tax=Chryseobacterium sp. OSA05B TaxID=2862650 RepID=UPI001CBEA04E|nr:choice-of-anchor J domain-containing protein [Chryseobacterium sp. OSA05B]
MKKLLSFMIMLPVFIFGQWTEMFDSGTTLPAGWAIINNGGSNGWTIRTPNLGATQSGANVAGITYNDTAHDDYLITKAIYVQAGISERIAFYVRSGSFLLENYEVLLSTTDQTQGAFSTVLQSEEKASQTWTKKTISLSAYVGQTVYVAIHATDTDQFYLFTDSFIVDAPPTTLPPCTTITLPINGATGVNADGVLNWDMVSSATGYKVKVGTTSGGTDIVNNIDAGDVTTYNIQGTLNAATTYYATIIPYNAVGDATSCTEIFFTTASAPANNDCSNATSLAVSSTGICVNPVSGTTAGATQSTGTTPTCAASGINDDVWYSFTATAATHLVTVNYTDNATATQVYSGSCGSFTAVACTDGGFGNSNVLLQSLTVGQVYYVRVYSSSSTATTASSFSICITSPVAPANDTCDTAIAIPCGGTVEGNNALAANETLPASTCGGTTTTASYKGVWYTVKAHAAGPITISACGAEFDSYLRVYSGSCSGLTCVSDISGVGYADSGCPGANLNNSSILTFNATAGTTYYVLLTGYTAARFGKYTISVTQDCSTMGTSEVKKENNLKAYPNPFADVLNISDISKVESVSIIDLAGRVVKTIDHPTSALRLRDLKQGVYLVTLNMKDGPKQTIKAIKK